MTQAIQLYEEANELLRQFDSHRNPHDLDRAIKLYQKSLNHDPYSSDSYVGLANAELRKVVVESDKRGFISGQPEDTPKSVRKFLDSAMKTAEKAVELDPNSPYAHLVLGRCLSYFSNLEDAAISEMEEAIRLDPEFLTAHHDIGRLYLKKGRKDKAAEYLQKATFSPNSGIASSAQQLLEQLS